MCTMRKNMCKQWNYIYGIKWFSKNKTRDQKCYLSVLFFVQQQNHISLVVDVDGFTLLKHIQTNRTLAKQTSETRFFLTNDTNHHQVAQILPPNYCQIIYPYKGKFSDQTICVSRQQNPWHGHSASLKSGMIRPHPIQNRIFLFLRTTVYVSLSLSVYVYIYIYIYCGSHMPCNSPHTKKKKTEKNTKEIADKLRVCFQMCSLQKPSLLEMHFSARSLQENKHLTCLMLHFSLNCSKRKSRNRRVSKIQKKCIEDPSGDFNAARSFAAVIATQARTQIITHK